MENGNERARVRFKTQFPNLKESTIRNFKKAYKEQLKKKAQVTALPTMPRGRPPLLMELDRKLLQFLNAMRARGGVINSHVVRATADALIRSNHSSGLQHLQNFSMPRSWVQSVYKRMGYTRRMGTTARPPVPKGLYDECRVSYLRDIETIREKCNIPPQLILSADQTPSSYVSVGKSIMAKRGDKSVAIKGLSDKRNITLTFVITLAGEFLPLQIIYGGKTDRCHPKDFRFPSGFCVSHNEKHRSNEEETIKLIDTIIVPYIVEKRSELNLPTTKKALVIWDVFNSFAVMRNYIACTCVDAHLLGITRVWDTPYCVWLIVFTSDCCMGPSAPMVVHVLDCRRGFEHLTGCKWRHARYIRCRLQRVIHALPISHGKGGLDSIT